MAKVRLLFEEKKDIFLYSTEIENLFISEFLPDAPGDYVKVYLFGLMSARYGQSFDVPKLAVRLGLKEEEIEEAWIYWESRGLIKTVTKKDERGEITKVHIFISQIEALYGNMGEDSDKEPQEVPAGDAAGSAPAEAGQDELPLYISIDDMDYDEVLTDKLIDTELKDIYSKYQEVTGRTVSRHETGKLADSIRDYGVPAEVMNYAIEYCAELGKDRVEYICSVAKRWTDEGCRNAEDIKTVLERYSIRNSWYGKVFKALGFNRLPAPADREIMDRWFDEMNLTIDEVIDACNAAAGRRDPNLRYINKVLENRMLEKGGVNTRLTAAAESASVKSEGSPVSRRVLNDYFNYLREESENSRKARTEEVCKKIPGMREIFEAEKRLNRKLLSVKPGETGRDERQALRAERLRIDAGRKDLLEEYGYPADYLKRQFRCDICRDTGYTDEGKVCSCCKERAKEAYVWIGDKNKA